MRRGGRTKNRTRIRSFVTSALALALPLSLAGPSVAYQRPGFTVQVDTDPLGQIVSETQRSTFYSSLSDSARFVAFDSNKSLVASDRNDFLSDVYVRDMRTGRLSLVSATPGGLSPPPIHDAMLCPGWDGQSGAGRYANDPTTQLNPLSWDPAISGNGRFVAFVSRSPVLVPGDTNQSSDIFLFDRTTATLRRVSVTSEGAQSAILAPDPLRPTCPLSFSPSIDQRGDRITFSSWADNLSEGSKPDRRGPDVFVHDRSSGKTTLVSVPNEEAGSCLIDQPLPDPLPSAQIGCPIVASATYGLHSSISANGRYVAFDTEASDMVPGDTNNVSDVFLRDLKLNKTERVSVDSAEDELGFRPANFGTNLGSRLGWQGGLPQHSVSRDGRFVVFISQETDAVPNDRNNNADVFVRDRKRGRTERISVASTGEENGLYASGLEPTASMSRDGRFVAWRNSGGGHMYVADQRTGQVESVSRASFAPDGFHCPDTDRDDGEALEPWWSDISATGRYVSETIICPGPGNRDGLGYVILRDRGPSVGTGGFSGSLTPAEEPPDDGICIEDICLPPGVALSSPDDTDDVNGHLTAQGANLYGASIAYRPQSTDLFFTIELEHMPNVFPGLSPISYGARFMANAKRYEVRATSYGFGTFGLFDCTNVRPACVKVADLKGGYGTTGMRVVFSLPLENIGIGDRVELTDVVAVSAVGSHLTGMSKVLDKVRLR